MQQTGKQRGDVSKFFAYLLHVQWKKFLNILQKYENDIPLKCVSCSCYLLLLTAYRQVPGIKKKTKNLQDVTAVIIQVNQPFTARERDRQTDGLRGLMATVTVVSHVSPKPQV